MNLNKIKQFFDTKTEEEVNSILDSANLSLGDYTEFAMAIDSNDLESFKRIITKYPSIGDLIDNAEPLEATIKEYSNPEDKKNQKKYYSDKARGFGMPNGRSPLPSSTKQLVEVAPEGMESWIESNKARFKKQYGKGYEKFLYGKAWNMKKQKTNESQTPSLGDTLANKVAFTDIERDLRLKQAREIEELNAKQKSESDVLNSKHKAEDCSTVELKKLALDSMKKPNKEMDIEIVVGQPEMEEEIMDFSGISLEDILSDLMEIPDTMVTEDNEQPLTGEEQRDLDKKTKELESKPGSNVSVVDSDTHTAEDSEFVGFDDKSGSAVVKNKRGDISIVDASSVSMKESKTSFDDNMRTWINLVSDNLD